MGFQSGDALALLIELVDGAERELYDLRDSHEPLADALLGYFEDRRLGRVDNFFCRRFLLIRLLDGAGGGGIQPAPSCAGKCGGGSRVRNPLREGAPQPADRRSYPAGLRPGSRALHPCWRAFRDQEYGQWSPFKFSNACSAAPIITRYPTAKTRRNAVNPEGRALLSIAPIATGWSRPSGLRTNCQSFGASAPEKNKTRPVPAIQTGLAGWMFFRRSVAGAAFGS